MRISINDANVIYTTIFFIKSWFKTGETCVMVLKMITAGDDGDDVIIFKQKYD